MSILVCDIGGTNTRLAFYDAQAAKLNFIQKFRNKDHEHFYDIVRGYLEQVGKRPSSVVLDLAGPVSAGSGKLTNLDWHITKADLAEATQCENVQLLNDLVAMGMSINLLPSDGLDVIRKGNLSKYDNAQSMVINLGTGFNTCPVIEAPDLTTFAVEAGHAATPTDVIELISKHIGSDRLADFDTVEKCFAGRRLAGLYGALWDTEPMDGAEIARQANAGDERGIKTLRLFQEMLGLYTGSTALNFLPQRGIYFAGSVARGALEFESAKHFLKALNKKRLFQDRIDAMPLKIINLDEAPLLGCAQTALQQFE